MAWLVVWLLIGLVAADLAIDGTTIASATCIATHRSNAQKQMQIQIAQAWPLSPLNEEFGTTLLGCNATVALVLVTKDCERADSNAYLHVFPTKPTALGVFACDPYAPVPFPLTQHAYYYMQFDVCVHFKLPV